MALWSFLSQQETNQMKASLVTFAVAIQRGTAVTSLPVAA